MKWQIFPRETWFGYRAVANHRFFTRIAKWLFIFILKCDCKPWFSFSCKNSLVSVLKNKTTCGKETTRLNQRVDQWLRVDQCRSCWTPGHSTHSTFSLGFLGDHCGRESGRSQGFTSDHSFVPRGVLEVYMMGGPTYFFGLKIYTLGIFLGLISERTFRFGFSLRSVDQKNIHSNFFSATCVPCPCIFLGWKFWCQVFFWV